MQRVERDGDNVIGYRHDRRRHARGLQALREISAPRSGAGDSRRQQPLEAGPAGS